MHQTSKGTLETTRLQHEHLDVEPGFEGFREGVERVYREVASPKLSRWKIFFSVASLGVIPVINFIASWVYFKMTVWNMTLLQQVDVNFRFRHAHLAAGTAPRGDLEKEIVQQYRRERGPLAQAMYAWAEGVPHGAPARA